MYEYKPLTYDYSALEPSVSSTTLHYHHDKHYEKYVNNLNALLTKNNYDYKYTLEQLVNKIDIFPIGDRDSILFNLGGVINHELYFNSMGSNNHEMVGTFKEKVEQDYGSTNNFIETYIKEANKLTGSGYTFLVLNKENKLEIINTSNQDTPISYGLYPIMTIDLWEHAYYLDYQNRRSDYINNFFQIVDYKKVEENYEKSKKALQENI